jgi:hypothetical protein
MKKPEQAIKCLASVEKLLKFIKHSRMVTCWECLTKGQVNLRGAKSLDETADEVHEQNEWRQNGPRMGLVLVTEDCDDNAILLIILDSCHVSIQWLNLMVSSLKYHLMNTFRLTVSEFPGISPWNQVCVEIHLLWNAKDILLKKFMNTVL